MKPSLLYVYILCVIALPYSRAQTKGPVAKFSFDDKKGYDEISQRPAKLVGTCFTEDRFGNPNYAVRTFGDAYSYINLGNDAALKQKTATISLWVKIERRVWSGKGYLSNVILLTKQTNEDDFYESYSFNYVLEKHTFLTSCCIDSLKQSTDESIKPVNLYEWYHMVMTYDNNFHCFYLNGVLQRRAKKDFETVFLNSDSVLIGVTHNKKNDRFMDGAIDDIAFYDRVLNPNEVLNLYNAPNPNKNRIFLTKILACLVIAGFVYLIFLFIKYRIKMAVKKERRKLELANKLLETELRVNRALMNPHFVFNSLNALQSFILKNENDQANNYLVKFSKLVRKMLENNMTESISLEMEIDLLTKYLEIEDLRFEENILYTIYTDPLLQLSMMKIPIMMIQPFIENAIWHGLLNKPGTKILNISFFLYESNYLQCIIEDNGLGRNNKATTNMERKSLGISFVKQRLQLFNKIYSLKCNLHIHDKPNQGGTVITINLPLLK